MKVRSLFDALSGTPSTSFFDKLNEIRFLEGRGSSAHAEIDPIPTPSRPCAPRLLRPRGDRPDVEDENDRLREAPPPTRRSTRQHLGSWAHHAGSSAHAEIDPCWRGCSAPARRLLRPRGDRPASQNANFTVPQAPPPTRRSTLGCTTHGPSCPGSSAHAEIDPPCRMSSATSCWLLRPRGDRPDEAP